MHKISNKKISRIPASVINSDIWFLILTSLSFTKEVYYTSIVTKFHALIYSFNIWEKKYIRNKLFGNGLLFWWDDQQPIIFSALGAKSYECRSLWLLPRPCESLCSLWLVVGIGYLNSVLCWILGLFYVTKN